MITKSRTNTTNTLVFTLKKDIKKPFFHSKAFIPIIMRYKQLFIFGCHNDHVASTLGYYKMGLKCFSDVFTIFIPGKNGKTH